jgi:hypothetical protein
MRINMRMNFRQSEKNVNQEKIFNPFFIQKDEGKEMKQWTLANCEEGNDYTYENKYDDGFSLLIIFFVC